VRVELSARARRDLQAIAEYIARDSPAAAERWVDKLRDVADLAAVRPLAGRIVPEWSDPNVREVFLRTYRVIYRIEKKRIVVLRVIEGRRPLRRR
jgi:plasmid stabilization system protein ParE